MRPSPIVKTRGMWGVERWSRSLSLTVNSELGPNISNLVHPQSLWIPRDVPPERRCFNPKPNYFGHSLPRHRRGDSVRTLLTPRLPDNEGTKWTKTPKLGKKNLNENDSTWINKKFFWQPLVLHLGKERRKLEDPTVVKVKQPKQRSIIIS